MDKVHRVLRDLGRVGLTALAYALAGWLALCLAAPPAYAAPFYPAAGVALAATLTFGRPAIVGTWLGAFVVNALLGDSRGLADWQAVATGGLIAAGAAAQALLGATLVGRRLPPPRELSEPRDALLLFGLGGALACLVSASVAVITLVQLQALPAAAAYATFVSWWSGDALGVLLGTPVVLTLIGQPRHVWAPRRLTVALPLVLLSAGVAVATLMLARNDVERSRGVFERDASRAADVLVWGLRTPLHALEAMHGLYLGSAEVSTAEFRHAASAWLEETPAIAALGFNQRLPRASLDDAARRISAEDGRPWRPFDRPDAPAGLTAGDADVYAMRQIEPAAGNAAALGVNVLSIPQARQAIERARRSETPQATAGFRLTQSTRDETGVVVYRAVASEPSSGDMGVVFVTLRTAEAAQELLKGTPAYLHWCLLDSSAPADAPRRVLGASGPCLDPAPGDLVHQRHLSFGGRQWTLTLHAAAADLPVEGRWSLALFAVTGLVSTAVLGTLLLTITGRTRRVEDVVAERTADLRHEVQERRRAEAALRESEARWRNMVDQIPVGVVYTDLAGGIREANPRLCEMLGLPAARLGAMGLDHLGAGPDAAREIRQLLQELGRSLGGVQRRLSLRRADGQAIEVDLLLSVLRDPQGLPLRVVGVVEDITEHLKLAQAERARENAEAASRAKSEFLSRVSHELRTPLIAILGFGQLLSLERDPALTPRQQGWNDQVQQAGWHLLSLINEMLDLARIESGEMRLAPSPQSPAALLGECLAMVGPAAQARGLQLEPVRCDTPDRVMADPVRLKQILTNLLSNAVKYNREGAAVRCQVRRGDANRVCIEVTDEGEGLSPAQLAHLFEPFNRLGREGSVVEGTGLGLVISLRLAEAMGGALHARSTPGQGATFVLELPVADESEDAAASAHAPLDGLSPAIRPERQVLYIEDNETNAEVMRGILGQRPQLQLEIQATGTDGLIAASARPPDLILLDMHLPDMDGLEVLARLRADPRLSGIPVLGVSADATADRIARARAAGVRDYITKPVDVAVLLGLIDDWLG